jgi:zinc finger MYND domain-containing protein 10
MPLNVISRITDTHDLLMLLVPLIENPPWTRRLEDGKWQKLIDQKWTAVAPIDLLKVTKLEGQPWLGLYHLLAKETFRKQYHLNSYRKNQVLRVRKYVNEVLLDQLPFLADIQRYMDELTVTDVPEPMSVGNSAFLFQQVAVTREGLLKGKNWSEVADSQMENVYTMTDKTDKDLIKMSDLYSDDLAGGVMDPQDC